MAYTGNLADLIMVDPSMTEEKGWLVAGNGLRAGDLLTFRNGMVFSSGPNQIPVGRATGQPIPGFVVDLDLGPADVVAWLRRRFPGREVSIARDESPYGPTHRLTLDGKVEHLALGQCSRAMALMAYRWLHWQDRHGLRAAFRAAITGHLAAEWTSYRHRVPGSRRALAMALRRTIPGVMRVFPGVGET